jgi:hypothetical protein
MIPPSLTASYSDLMTIINLRSRHDVIFQSGKNIFLKEFSILRARIPQKRTILYIQLCKRSSLIEGRTYQHFRILHGLTPDFT